LGTAFTFHFIEALITGGFPLALAYFFGAHQQSLVVINTFGTINSILVHAGYALYPSWWNLHPVTKWYVETLFSITERLHQVAGHAVSRRAPPGVCVRLCVCVCIHLSLYILVLMSGSVNIYLSTENQLQLRGIFDLLGPHVPHRAPQVYADGQGAAPTRVWFAAHDRLADSRGQACARCLRGSSSHERPRAERRASRRLCGRLGDDNGDGIRLLFVGTIASNFRPDPNESRSNC
jgi:hypothetical protein